MENKSQFDLWLRNDGRKNRVRERSAFMNRLFNVRWFSSNCYSIIEYDYFQQRPHGPLDDLFKFSAL